MADIADKANDLAEEERQRVLERRKNDKPVCTLTECEECGDDIPAERRKAVPHTRLCVFCQEIKEKFNG